MPFYQGQATNYLTLLDELRDFVTDEATTWSASTAYSVGDFIIPTTPNGYRYRCTNAGTSGTAEPSWGTTIGGTTLDDVSTGDSVIWTCVNETLGSDKWTIVEETYVSGTSTDGILWLEGIGVNSNEVYIGINTVSNVGVGSYNWELNGAVDWNSGISFYNQTGSLNASTVSYILLSTDPINFTFVADSKRILIYARVAGLVTETAYLGLLDLYFPYNAYPYPILIGGTSGTDQIYSSTSNHAWFLDPDNTDIVRLRDNNGNWLIFDGAVTGFLDNYLYNYPTSFLNSSTINLTDNIDGSYLVHPISIMQYETSSDSVKLIGEYNGVFWVAGYSLSTGDTITISGIDYYVINDTNETTENRYACIKLD